MALFKRETWRRLGLLAGIVGVLALAGGIGGALFIYYGVYSVAATQQHTAPIFKLLDFAMRRSVRVRAARIEVPPLSDPAMIEMGLGCYRIYCIQCHGAPGVAPHAEGIGLMPLPASLAQTAHEWPAADLFWVTKHGVRMAGMPAWEFRMSDAALWSTVAFLKRLPSLSAAGYRELSAATAEGECPKDEQRVPGSIRERGTLLMRQYACITCHRIPGVVGPEVYVGPPLHGMGRRTYVAGVIPNTRENLARFIMDPQSVSPDTLMPDLRVSEAHAYDMAAYLETLE